MCKITDELILFKEALTKEYLSKLTVKQIEDASENYKCSEEIRNKLKQKSEELIEKYYQIFHERLIEAVFNAKKSLIEIGEIHSIILRPQNIFSDENSSENLIANEYIIKIFDKFSKEFNERQDQSKPYWNLCFERGSHFCPVLRLSICFPKKDAFTSLERSFKVVFDGGLIPEE